MSNTLELTQDLTELPAHVQDSIRELAVTPADLDPDSHLYAMTEDEFTDHLRDLASAKADENLADLSALANRSPQACTAIRAFGEQF